MAPRSQPHPGEHPPPTSTLFERPLPLIETKGPWFRIHGVAREPLYFGGSGNNRFDDPQHAYGALYVGSDAHCAFIETYGQLSGAVDITRIALAKRKLCRITANRPLRLVDLSAAGLARMGGDGRLTAGDHAIAQLWSRACWEQPDAPDGVAYRARHDQSRVCIALFNRSDIVFTTEDLGTLLDDNLSDLLDELLDMYGLGLT